MSKNTNRDTSRSRSNSRPRAKTKDEALDNLLARTRDGRILDKESKNIFDPVDKYHEASPDKVFLMK